MWTRAAVQRFYDEVWNAGDLTVVSELMASNVSFRGSLGSALKGHEAFAGYVRSVREALAGYHCEIQDFVGSETRAAARMMFSGRHDGVFRGYEPTGQIVSWAGAAFFTFESGLITDLWVLGDLHNLTTLLDANRDAATSSKGQP